MNRITYFDTQRNLFSGPTHIVSSNSAYHGKQFATVEKASEYITQVHLREIKNAILDFMILVKSRMQVNVIPADNASITAISSIEEHFKLIGTDNAAEVASYASDVFLGFMEHFLSEKKAKRLDIFQLKKLKDAIGVVRSFVNRYSTIAF